MLPSGSTLPGHVLVVGVDGVRFDFLEADSAPSVRALGEAGFLVPVPVDEATPTWSGPCWATIATGHGVAGHGITGNDLTGHRLAEHGLEDVMAKGGAMGGLLARVTEDGVRAWTLEQAAAEQGLELLDGMAAYALHHGALVAWSMATTDQRQAELAAAQLELPA